MDRGELVNDAERRLWDAFTRGESVDLGAGDPTAEDFDPEQWGPSRTVRAEVIMGLLLGVRDEERGRIAKVVLVGARIDGTLDLNGGATPYELSLERCWLEQTPDFGETSTKSLVAIACRFPGLVAHGWQSAGPALLADARFTGEIDLTGARVGGVLDLSGATLTNPDGHALNAQNLTVEQDILCCDGFTATGAIDLNGAKVGGQLDMSGATLINPDGDALNGQNLTVEQDMFCGDGFTATGGVGLAGAKVGGTLSMSGATLINPDGDALSAYDLTVEQGMFCRDRFTAAGAINLSGAKVGGQLDMSGATLINPDGDALNGQNLTVEQDMFCRNGFTATGAIDLSTAKVGGQLDMSGATLTNPDGRALNAYNLTVERGMFCSDGFTVLGTIRLIGARLDDVNFAHAILRLRAGADPSTDLILECEAMTAARLTLPTALSLGVTDVRRAALRVLEIPVPALAARMRLSGLTYTDLDPDPDPPVKRRIAWLGRDPDGYHPQPYEQLAGYYRANGHDREARRVLLAKRRARRGTVTDADRRVAWRRLAARLRRLPGLIVDGLAGYGYAPGRAFAWLLAATALGTWLLYDAAPANPTGNHVANALLLALDAILPTSPLGLREAANLTGGLYVTAIVLQGFGFALSLAVLPALTRALARADK